MGSARCDACVIARSSCRWTLPLVRGYWEQRQVRRHTTGINDLPALHCMPALMQEAACTHTRGCGQLLCAPQLSGTCPIIACCTPRFMAMCHPVCGCLLHIFNYVIDSFICSGIRVWPRAYADAAGSPRMLSLFLRSFVPRPFIQSFQSFSQSFIYSFLQVSVFGRALTLTLLARRSRHFAGTRFRKRGLSSAGFVANDVESEQIVDAGIDWATGQPLWSAMAQVRVCI